MCLLNKMCNVNFVLGTLTNTAGLCFCCVCVGLCKSGNWMLKIL